MSKIKVKVCRICLRSDVGAKDVDASINDFYDELCEYDTHENQSLKYCRMCEYQLRKCYNFKQKCLRANAVLKAWRKKKLTIFPKNLHVLLPPPSLGLCSPLARRKAAHYKYTDHGPTPDDAEKDTEESVFGHQLLENTQSNDSNDAQENIPLSNMRVTGLDIDLKDIEIQLKEENDGFDSDVDNAYHGTDSDYIDSELEEAMDRYIKTEVRKPNTRSKSKTKPEKSKSKTEPKPKSIEPKLQTKVEKIRNNCKVKTKIEFADVDYGNSDDDTHLATDMGIEGGTEINEGGTEINEGVTEMGNGGIDLDDQSPQANKKYMNIKQRILEIFDRGEIHELGDNSKMTKEIFLKIYDNFLLSDMRMLSLKKDSQGEYHKLKKALLHLLKKYNPDYETVFEIEYLDTEEKKLGEFNRRKDSKSYVNATYKCELCYRGFEKHTQFQYHNKWHTPAAGEFLCGICGMRFQSLKTRASHRASSHSAVYSCKMCPLITYHYPVMLNHYEQHKGVEYSCPTCLSVFENKTTFMNHQRDHNADKKKSTCASCAMTFISDVGLMLHRKSKHTDEIPVNPGAHSTCQECNITFDTGEVYLKHVALSHTKKVESYRCAYCHIRFGTLEELRTHKVEQGHQRASKKYAQRSQRSNDPNPVKKIKINTPDKPFVKCELCPAMVSTAYTSCMYKHFLKDHPDIPYSSVYSQTARRLLCDLCGKTFMDPAFFADHANMHSGLKPYLCTQCPARFATRRHLGLHAQRHGPARHVCNHCGKRFHSAANLFNHRKTHIGDRRFKCEICFKGFLHAATLNEHVRGVHHHIRKQKPPRDRKISY